MKTMTAIAKKKTLKPIKSERTCVIVLEKSGVFQGWASEKHLLKDFKDYNAAFNSAIDIAKQEKCQVVKIYEIEKSKWKALNEKTILAREDMYYEHVVFELYAHRTFSL